MLYILRESPLTDSFTQSHEIEAEITYDHITLNFEHQDGSSSQIVVQKEVLDHISLYKTQFLTPRRGLFQVFMYKREAGSAFD